MKFITAQIEKEKEVSVKDQMKKFLIKGFYGFNTILTFGLGRRLGIFDYLYEKSKSSAEKTQISSIIFTIEELSEKLNLDLNYLDAWVHLGLECGLFEISDSNKREIKTAPHVYSLLIDRNHMFYVGDTIGAFYYLAPFQDLIIEAFKKEKSYSTAEVYEKFPEEAIKDSQRMSARVGSLIERLFSRNFKDFCKTLRSESSILSVGCGYGYNLTVWANKYKKAKFVGLDIDSKGIKSAQSLIQVNNWSDRVEIIETPIDEYAKKTDKKFDLILLNQVLHEMDRDKNYRLKVFHDLYSLLKEDGILLIGESMIYDTFESPQEFQLFDVMHKFFEASFAGFYDEKSFKEFINATPFKNSEFIKEKGTYFWVVRK
ncbi:MAG: class I SAM-dependent methyltransferase [Candidatus Hodarchaeota archaeon]